MKDKERLEIVWCAINCMFEPSDIMHAIEQAIGEQELLARWSAYTKTRNTTAAISRDLNAMKRRRPERPKKKAKA